jgi:hypothetical protein
MGVGMVYNDRQCPGCNGERTFPCKPDDDIDRTGLKPVTPSVRCDGVSDERAACLAQEEQETMERVGSAMNLHRQICRPCMAEDKVSLQHSMGY